MDYMTIPTYLESPARQLFRRCVQCPDVTPSCPQCADNEECSFDLGGCNACPSNTCIQNPSATATSTKSSPAGPIAGGVIGGIIVVIGLVALLYFFYVKKRREQQMMTPMETFETLRQMGEGEKTPSEHMSFAEQRSKRQSAQSVATMKTSHSRDSNAIQIAYIPGVTSTAAHSPDMIPPVPPIPAAGTTSPHLNTGSEQFFMIGDIRPASTYSNNFGGDRKSYARSVARSSIAASEYHSNAIVDPMPARAAVTARAVPISVRSNSRVGSPVNSPPLSHQNSVTGRMQGPMTGQSGQAKQVTIGQKGSNLGDRTHFAFEMEDTSPSVTPRIGVDRSGTASPRSVMSDDDRSAHRLPVSAVRSEFSQTRNSPVSNYGWEQPGGNIRNTIRDATQMAYGHGQPVQQPSTTLHNIAELDGDAVAHNDPKSPFGDRHAMRTP